MTGSVREKMSPAPAMTSSTATPRLSSSPSSFHSRSRTASAAVVVPLMPATSSILPSSTTSSSSPARRVRQSRRLDSSQGSTTEAVGLDSGGQDSSARPASSTTAAQSGRRAIPRTHSSSIDSSPSLSSISHATTTVHPSQLHLSCGPLHSAQQRGGSVAMPESSTSFLPSFHRTTSNPGQSDPPTRSRSATDSATDEDDGEEEEEKDGEEGATTTALSLTPTSLPHAPFTVTAPNGTLGAVKSSQLSPKAAEVGSEQGKKEEGVNCSTAVEQSTALTVAISSPVQHPYAPSSPSVRSEGQDRRTLTSSSTSSLHLPSSSSPMLVPSVPPSPSTLAPPPRPRVVEARRTLPSTLARLPFFLRPPSASPASPTRATTTTAGPAGYLASLEPHQHTSPRPAGFHSSDGLAPPSPSSAAGFPSSSSSSSSSSFSSSASASSSSAPRSVRRSSLPASEGAAGVKRAAFFASVAFALGRMSVNQKSNNTNQHNNNNSSHTSMKGSAGGGGGGSGAAGATSPSSVDRLIVKADRRPSGSHVGGSGPSPAVKPPPALTTSDEVTPLSPHFLSPPSPPPPLFSPIAAPLSPLPCPFQPGLLSGSYSRLPFHAHFHSSSSSSGGAPPLLPPSGRMSQRFLESWSESDDPLSPASFQEIVPGVYLGSAKSALNIDRLLQHRITHVLTVMNRPLNLHARPDDAADADQLSFGGSRQWQEGKAAITVPTDHPLFHPVLHSLAVNFVYLLDVPEADLLSALDECLPYVRYAAGESGSGARVLIHCQAGISRSASVVIAYLVHRFGLTVREAWERCSQQRPYINPNEGFVSQLDMFAKAEERHKRREARRWRERMKRWGGAHTAKAKELLNKATVRHLRPKPLPTEARREGEEDHRQHSEGEPRRWWQFV